MIWALIPNWLKIASVGLLCAALLSSGSYWLGKSVERADLVVKATTKAISKIQTMEENNAAFRDLTPRHKCLVLMRDSGLPDSACD
jgi:hypothetical protein